MVQLTALATRILLLTLKKHKIVSRDKRKSCEVLSEIGERTVTKKTSGTSRDWESYAKTQRLTKTEQRETSA